MPMCRWDAPGPRGPGSCGRPGRQTAGATPVLSRGRPRRRARAPTSRRRSPRPRTAPPRARDLLGAVMRWPHLPLIVVIVTTSRILLCYDVTAPSSSMDRASVSDCDESHSHAACRGMMLDGRSLMQRRGWWMDQDHEQGQGQDRYHGLESPLQRRPHRAPHPRTRPDVAPRRTHGSRLRRKPGT